MNRTLVTRVWKISGLGILVFQLLLILFCVFFGGLEKSGITNPLIHEFVYRLTKELCAGFGLFLLYFMILYQRSCKKLGTTLLSLSILGFLAHLPKQIQALTRIHKQLLLLAKESSLLLKYLNYFEVGLVSLTALSLVWVFCCAFLRKCNLLKRVENLKEDKVASAAIESLSNASDFGELKKIYRMLKKEYKKEGWYFKQMYQKRKKELKIV